MQWYWVGRGVVGKKETVSGLWAVWREKEQKKKKKKKKKERKDEE